MNRHSRRERGQATVELALVLPVLALLVAGVIAVGVVAATQVSLENAAREAARAAALEPPAARARAVEAATRSLGATDHVVAVEVGPEYVTVRVSAEAPLTSMIPGLSARRLEADATFRREDLVAP